MKIFSHYKKFQADTHTPVSIYLRLRDKFAHPLLLESSDYHSRNESASILCFDPIATFSASGNSCTIKNAIERSERDIALDPKRENVISAFEAFRKSFSFSEIKTQYPYNGFFGFTAYDAMRMFDAVHSGSSADADVPGMIYSLYSVVIVINHFNDELFIFSNAESDAAALEKLTKLIRLLEQRSVPAFEFRSDEPEVSDCTDEEFIEMVRTGKRHCRRGDVFQVVLSRLFRRKFSGDEFEVYRALRNVNPSPYLYYFDFGNFKLFGSSPEAQLIVKKGIAEIHPIAGTVKRTGDDEKDLEMAEALRKNEKENAEHIMLVDLARNDLSHHCRNVKVEKLREIQFYSHVIHLVSKVTGKIREGADVFEAMKDSFPAGTLSGAPKVRAMQIIAENERSPRGYYGGAVGFIGANEEFNHAIIIRSFMSKGNVLHYRAGAGVVDASDELSELNEVENKVGALRKAISSANEKFSSKNIKNSAGK